MRRKCTSLLSEFRSTLVLEPESYTEVCTITEIIYYYYCTNML